MTLNFNLINKQLFFFVGAVNSNLADISIIINRMHFNLKNQKILTHSEIYLT